jgi:ribosome-associated heat shock protein Hsp15
VSAAETPAERHRLDRWLWFCRFYKTRSLATQAISGGKVHVNGERIKASHAVRLGDLVTVTIQQESLEVNVLAIPQRRGPASEAQACYAETAESAKRRMLFREQRRVAELSRPQSDTRPDKRERRQLDKLRRGQAD